MNDIIKQYIENPLGLYNDRFFRKYRRAEVWEKGIGREIVNFFSISSVVDFGCGLGFYLEGALEEKAEVLGFEYGYEIAKKYLSQIIFPYIKFGNVMEEINCGKFDCAMSIEVAEHILPEKSDMFVKNIVNATNRYIVLTAAPPGQSGTGHINLHPLTYWIDKFEQCGFNYSENIVKKFILHIKSKNLRLPRYIRRNLMIFEKVVD